MTTTASVAAGTWTVDLAHTRAAFTARHFFGQPVHGTITVTARRSRSERTGAPSGSTRRSTPARSAPRTPGATPTCAANASSPSPRTR